MANHRQKTWALEEGAATGAEMAKAATGAMLAVVATAYSTAPPLVFWFQQFLKNQIICNYDINFIDYCSHTRFIIEFFSRGRGGWRSWWWGSSGENWHGRLPGWLSDLNTRHLRHVFCHQVFYGTNGTTGLTVCRGKVQHIQAVGWTQPWGQSKSCKNQIFTTFL